MGQGVGISGKLRQFTTGAFDEILDAEFWMIAPVLALLGVLSLITDAWSAPGLPGSHFEVGASVESLKFEKILTSPTMVERGEEVFAQAVQSVQSDPSLSPEARDAVLRELAEVREAARSVNRSGQGSRDLDSLPFKRILDLTLIFPGIPDVLGLCLEAYPTNNLSIEGCATTAIFISSLTATIKYRWDLILKETSKGRIHELLLGPGAGIRHVSYLCFDACQDASLYADAVASLEYNYWFRPHFGFTLQLDGGATFMLGRIDDPLYGRADVPPVIPVGRLSFGLAF